ncbi:unnamed protein product [Owenia fusiformis]|uniref:DNA alkylation repair protein n=1 Tax=Owenia fusiformis TaxID=6347 RepID=A0A8S4PMI4_OWEFU|nr:unnamed protein product [Owenia fusiformis]
MPKLTTKKNKMLGHLSRTGAVKQVYRQLRSKSIPSTDKSDGTIPIAASDTHDTTNKDIKAIINKLTNLYSQNANEKNAIAQKKYMRNQFEFFGLMSPERKQIDKEVLQCSPKLSLKDTRELLLSLWQQDQREFQQFALTYATKYKERLCGETINDCLESLECIKKLITTKSWWDTIDMLCPKGHFILKHRAELSPVMDEWIMSDNMWLRRCAIYHQLYYKENTNQDQLFRYCKACAHEKDFFIRKVIGWSLRSYFRTDPDAVKTFVKDNEIILSTLSKREALKHA